MSFGRPLGQCCRYCRQHCTGLALRTPGSPLRCLRQAKGPGVPIAVYDLRARRGPRSNVGRAQLHARTRAHEVAEQRLIRESIQSSAANVDDARALGAEEYRRVTRARPQRRSHAPGAPGRGTRSRASGPGCRGARAQCNAAGRIGSIGRAVARRGSPVREHSAHGAHSARSAPESSLTPVRAQRFGGGSASSRASARRTSATFGCSSGSAFFHRSTNLV